MKKKKKICPQEQTRKGYIFIPGSHFSTNSNKTLVRRCHLQLDCSAFSSPRVVELQETRYSTVPCRRLHHRSAFTLQLFFRSPPFKVSEGDSQSRRRSSTYIHPSNSSTHTNILSIPTSALPLHPLRTLSAPLTILGTTTTDQNIVRSSLPTLYFGLLVLCLVVQPCKLFSFAQSAPRFFNLQNREERKKRDKRKKTLDSPFAIWCSLVQGCYTPVHCESSEFFHLNIASRWSIPSCAHR